MSTFEIELIGQNLPVVWLGQRDMCTRLKTNDLGIARRVDRGEIPRPHKISTASIWLVQELEAWEHVRARGAHPTQPAALSLPELLDTIVEHTLALPRGVV